MHRDRRPIIIAGIAALVSCGLLAAAVWQGWLGPNVGRGTGFCEAARPGLIKQPANTVSNIGFVADGLLIAWQAGAPRGRRARMSLFTAIFMAVIVVLLGPASAAMHATQSTLGGHLDMLSMFLIASLAAAYAITRLFRAGPIVFSVTFAAGIVIGEIAENTGPSVPVVMTSGNTAFGVLLLLALALELVIMRRRSLRITRGWGFAAAGTLALAFVIWNLTNDGLCSPRSVFQGHAAWHLLDALAAYFLYRYYASEVSTVTHVGVTGHIRLAAEAIEPIRAAVRAALAPSVEGGLVVVSAIAAGADSIVAEEALELGGTLEVILPAADYRTRVVGPDSARFDSLLERAISVTVAAERSGPEAYRAANETMLAAIDVLLAIWDGQGAPDAGGTAAAVALAHARGIPVTVIWPAGASRVVSVD